MQRRDPIEVDPASSASLIRDSFALSQRLIAPALVTSMIYGCASNVLGVHTFGWSAYSLSVGLLGHAFPQRWAFLLIVTGRRPEFRKVIAHILRRYGRLFAVSFWSGVEVALLGLMLLVPGVVCMLNYFIAFPIAIHEAGGSRSALDFSRTLMRGHRVQALIAYTLLCLPGIVLTGIGTALITMGSKLGLPPPPNPELGRMIMYAAVAVLGIPSSLLSTVLHLKVSCERAQLSALGDDTHPKW
jgi:hypothetical protein